MVERKKQPVIYKGPPSIRLIDNLAVGEHNQSPQRKNCQTRVLYSGKLLLRNEGKTNTILDKQNGKNVLLTYPL